MKSGKKVLSIVLCLIMVFGTVVIGGSVVSAEKGTACQTGDVISFGSYPQSDVTDIMGSTLNAQSVTWQSYGYYSGSGDFKDGQMAASDYMKYCDVNFGGNKYRGVVFDSYRPTDTGYTSNTSVPRSCQVENGYIYGNVYWFKYEPLRWRILDASTGLVMCETVIDSQPYNNYLYSNGEDVVVWVYEAYWGDPDQTYYSNNYEYSSIRQWLNNDFYATAFSQSQQEKIKTTTLNNDSYSPSVSKDIYAVYNSASTNDKIFLLSYDEVMNPAYGFSSNYSDYDIARQAKGSDYAKCQGLKLSNTLNTSISGNALSWSLRSPSYSIYSLGVYYSGMVASCIRTCETSNGIRPAMCLTELKSETFAIPEHTKEFLAKDAVSISEENGVYTYTYADGEVIVADRPFWEEDENVSPSHFSSSEGSFEIVYTNGVRLTISNPAQRLDNYGRPCIFADEYDWSYTNSPSNMAFGPVLSPGDEGYVPPVLDDSDNPSQDIPEANIIKGNSADNKKTYGYRTTVTFTADVPEGGSVQWYVDGSLAGSGSTLTVKDKTDDYTVKVVVTDKNGNKIMDEEQVTIKHSFFDILIWFFVHLFNPKAYDVKQ
ncbi:MAG: hypothetical protein IKH65_08130 [Clostridia bacterium]|nr:hypothetical protein [Clostridia bacterium]